MAFSCNTDKVEYNLTDGVLISEVTVISTEEEDYQPFVGYVVTENDKIVYVGEELPTTNGNFIRIDGRGKFLIPGLIDSHVHVTEVQGMVYHHQEKHPELAGEFIKQMPRSYLYFGFTTLINLGGISEEQLSSFESQPLKPD